MNSLQSQSSRFSAAFVPGEHLAKFKRLTRSVICLLPVFTAHWWTPRGRRSCSLPFLEWPWELLRKFLFNEWECTLPWVHWCHQSSCYTAKPPAGGDISIKRIWKVAPEMYSSQNFLCIYRTLFWGPQKNVQLAQFFSPQGMELEAPIWRVALLSSTSNDWYYGYTPDNTIWQQVD